MPQYRIKLKDQYGLTQHVSVWADDPADARIKAIQIARKLLQSQLVEIA